MIIRTLLLVILLVGGAIAVEPTWDGKARSLVLRLRSPVEMVGFVRATTERFAESGGEGESESTPPVASGADVNPADVAAGPVSPDETPQEKLTTFERFNLERLVREKTLED